MAGGAHPEGLTEGPPRRFRLARRSGPSPACVCRAGRPPSWPAGHSRHRPPRPAAGWPPYCPGINNRRWGLIKTAPRSGERLTRSGHFPSTSSETRHRSLQRKVASFTSSNSPSNQDHPGRRLRSHTPRLNPRHSSRMQGSEGSAEVHLEAAHSDEEQDKVEDSCRAAGPTQLHRQRRRPDHRR